jgi:hypothetical protein
LESWAAAPGAALGKHSPVFMVSTLAMITTKLNYHFRRIKQNNSQIAGKFEIMFKLGIANRRNGGLEL